MELAEFDLLDKDGSAGARIAAGQVHSVHPVQDGAPQQGLIRIITRGPGWSPPPMGFYLGILTDWAPP